jgi:hypothetical protein
MDEIKQYSKQQMSKSLKFVFELLKYELNANSESKKFVDAITNNFSENLGDGFFIKNVIQLEDEFGDYLLEKHAYDVEKLQAINDYRYNNDRLIIVRNFLLLLYFMRALYLPIVLKYGDKTSVLIKNLPKEPNYYKTPNAFYEDMFITDEYGHNGLKTNNTIFNKNIEKEFSNFIFSIFESRGKDIHLNLSMMFDRSLEAISNETNQKKNIRKFINAFSKLLTRGNQTIISLFFELHKNEFGHMDVPQSIIKFLHYYVYINPQQEYEYTKKSLYVNGIGTSNILAKFIGEIKGEGGNDYNFSNDDLFLATEDNNPLSEHIRIIYNRLIAHKAPNLDIQNNQLFDDKIDTKYNAIISIIPPKLDLFIEQEAIKKYPLYPSQQISFYAYYYKAIKHMNQKALMIVPISFMNTNAYSIKLFADDISLLNNGDDIDRNETKIKSASYQEFLHHYRMSQIIKQRKINKVILLPKGIFYHTDKQCVLIELTHEENSGIYFADITNFDQLIIPNSTFPSFENMAIEKHKNLLYYIPSLVSKSRYEIIDQMIKEGSALFSKFVSYDDIILSSNLLPTYHLRHQQHNTDKQQQEITEYFDVIKLQKFTVDSSSIKDENIDVGYFSQSEFSSYGITSNDELTNIVKTKIKQDNKRVDRLYRVYNNDILIYVHYKDRKDMTMVQIHNDDICIGMHNLIAIRLKEQYQKQDGYAKALFLWLMSDNGQKQLQSITKVNSANRPLISIDDLKMLQVDMSVLDDAKASFRKVENEIVKIKKSIKFIKDLIG